MSEPRHSSAVPRHLAEQAPLNRHFADDLDEGQIKQMWQRIDHAPTKNRRAWLWAPLAAAALLLLTLGFFRARSAEPRQLALLSGGTPTVLSADAAPSASRFDDGSQVNLAAGTRLEVLRNDARSFVTALRRGGVTFDVKPGGPRHWVIEAGELSVEVVGTRFRVERAEIATRVSVEHGIVMVRGERVPGGSVRLTAGKSFELPTALALHPEPRSAPAVQLPAAPSAAPVVASAGRVDKAPAAPSVASAEPEARDEVERALRAADAARHSSDNAAAIRYFDTALRQAAPGDARRGLAALSLARLLIAGDPAKAAAILRSSLSDMPQALLEDASVRLVEAESRAGNHDAAARAAADYLRRFPAGRRADEVRRWSEP
jgi:transmembrane sensor